MSNKEFLQAIGMELKIARIRKGLSIRELSDKSGLSEQCIGQVEGGKSDGHILTYKRIADALEFDLWAVI